MDFYGFFWISWIGYFWIGFFGFLDCSWGDPIEIQKKNSLKFQTNPIRMRKGIAIGIAIGIPIPLRMRYEAKKNPNTYIELSQ